MTSDNKFSHLKQAIRSRRVYVDPNTGDPLPRQLRADQLHPHPDNPKHHPEKQHEVVAGSLDTLGQIDAITINIRNGMIVDGHERAWLALGYSDSTMVDVDYVDLSEDEHKLALAVYDETGRYAQYDRDSLDSLLQQVNTDNASVQAMLAEMASSQGLYFGEQPEIPEDVGAQVDRADELQAVWQVNKGDMWLIPSITGSGEHRLLCGDSTNADDVARVMDGDKADAVITDPPYGIGVDKSMHEKGGQQYGNAAAPKRYYPDTNWDSTTPDKNTLDTIRFFATEVVIWGGNYFDLPPARCYLVWDKQNGANHFADCELAWTNMDKPIRIVHHLWNGMLREGGEDRLPHPTQKPLEVITWAIQQFMKNPLLIYDPFLGSGTTMAACETLGRICFGIEIDPAYCAVILQRMTDLGCMPVKAPNAAP